MSYKAYMPFDYYRVDVWEIPEKGGNKEYKEVFVSRAQAYRNEKPDKPHPAATFIMSLYKGDVIGLKRKDDNNFLEYCCVAGYSTTQNKIDIQPIYASDTIKAWKETTNTKYCSNFWPDDCNGQNYKSINVLFSNYVVFPVKISVDGRIFFR
jgi:hypothetical protein